MVMHQDDPFVVAMGQPTQKANYESQLRLKKGESAVGSTADVVKRTASSTLNVQSPQGARKWMSKTSN